MAQVTKDTTIGELLSIDPNTAGISYENGNCIALDARLLRERLWKRLLWFMDLTAISLFSRSMIFSANKIGQRIIRKAFRICGTPFWLIKVMVYSCMSC